jgi:predicted site-specific integrase-resolvase
MKIYSISETARIAKVDRRTLHRWIAKGEIPRPKAEIVEGQLRKSWTDEQVTKIKEYKKSAYWGKGIDKKTGKKPKKE